MSQTDYFCLTRESGLVLLARYLDPSQLSRPLLRLARAGTAACALVFAVAAQAEQVREIRFAGNEQTIDKTMLQEITIRPGDDVDRDQIDLARQAIMDLGLFKKVTAEISSDNVLTFTVEEKHYWFVLPRLSRSGDGDISYGVAYRMHNLRGRNETIVLGAKRTELTDADLDKRDEVSLRYTNPRLMDSPVELRLDVRYEQSEIDEIRGNKAGMYARDLGSFRVALARWLNPEGLSQGWRVGAGVLVRDYAHDLVSGDPGLYGDATVVSLTGNLEYKSVHDRLYSRDGHHFGYGFNVASDSVISDASFTRHNLFYRMYKPVTDRPHTTLNVQLRAGYANRTVFGNPAFSLGGSNSLRGFERDTVEGDAYVLANVEFLTPLFGKNSVRGVLFADIGNAYRDVDNIDLSDMNYGAGFGLRWALESFVRTELRIDFAHGFGDNGVSKVYASTKATF